MASAAERDWVNVANDLLTKCNIHLQVNSLSDCGAEVFVHLYESILGEKVPDFIAVPTCQEDNIHNVQAVIDSLALDYLQISLSHITGENIVKGDKESIRNLLEIFDGLLEYLTEEISETASQHDGGLKQIAETEVQHTDSKAPEDGSDIPVPSLEQPSTEGSSQSSDLLDPSSEAGGSESTSELIKLGDTAYLFSLRNEVLPPGKEVPKKAAGSGIRATFRESFGLPSSGKNTVISERPAIAKPAQLSEEQLSSSAKKLGDPIRPAIALQPPYQPSVSGVSYLAERNNVTGDRDSPPPLLPLKPQERPATVLAEPPERESPVFSDGIQSFPDATSYFPTEPSGTGVDVTVESVPLASSHDSEKEIGKSSQYTSIQSCKENGLPQFTSIQTTKPKQRNLFTGKSQKEGPALADSFIEDSLPHRRAKERLSAMSEKLSRRLNELDAMLKHALGEQSQDELSADEDTLSQHSDSIMDYRQIKQQSDIRRPRKAPNRRRSFSASPPPSNYQPSHVSDSPLQKDAEEPARRVRICWQNEQDQRKLRAKEQKFKENILKGTPRISHAAKIYSRKNIPRHSKLNQRISRGGFAKPKKAAPMKVKENDLLPLLLKDFPHMNISHPTMNKMWQQQLSQIEQFKSPRDRNQWKLQNEVLETLKKHNLLVDLLKREQAHNRRLQEFRQRIERQKCTQNKMRERRQQIARAKKYYQDYRVQLRAKMMRTRTREERIFKQLFEEGLEIQKQRFLELRSYAKEKRAEQKKQYQDELQSMENYYKDQFAMLAEAVSEERREIQTRERAHTQTLNKVKRELRSKLEKEIKELQDMITHDDDDLFFRELEADRLKSRLLVASFQCSKNYLFL
ncbi:centrosomal protein of 95 kDa isoform X2 [Ahaetulla prasina]|uniref:centrosomal protein of 95 kDa isoform X2 n=1 Tax=Ahaetulla prasina TaxID=499056 RepID=UPI002649418F|nr:centrosomal protein of 95 kDa isoform X2 [Ahaetulla prasina]